MRTLGENPDGPMVALAAVPYTVTEEDDLSYEAPDKLGYVEVPTVAELLVLCGDGEGSLRYADTRVGFLRNPNAMIRGKHVIPNLVRQMEAMGAYIASCVSQGGTRELSYTTEGVESEEGWEIHFILEKDGTVIKRYTHEKGHCFEAKLSPDGQLLLPRLPAGVELAF